MTREQIERRGQVTEIAFRPVTGPLPPVKYWVRMYAAGRTLLFAEKAIVAQ
jgi:hypothetical protein